MNQMTMRLVNYYYRPVTGKTQGSTGDTRTMFGILKRTGRINEQAPVLQ